MREPTGLRQFRPFNTANVAVVVTLTIKELLAGPICLPADCVPRRRTIRYVKRLTDESFKSVMLD